MILCRRCQSERSEVNSSSTAREESVFCSGVCSEGHGAAPEQSNTTVFVLFHARASLSPLWSFKELAVPVSTIWLLVPLFLFALHTRPALFLLYTITHTLGCTISVEVLPVFTVGVWKLPLWCQTTRCNVDPILLNNNNNNKTQKVECCSLCYQHINITSLPKVMKV